MVVYLASVLERRLCRPFVGCPDEGFIVPGVAKRRWVSCDDPGWPSDPHVSISARQLCIVY